ncbi:hypothetical protein JCM15519_26060 [Fundidesulfovibrio butyratiphilus]
MGKSLNTKDAAAFLGLSAGTLEVWRSQGKGPKYAKLGRRVLYDPADLESFRNARKVLTIDTMPERAGR